MRGRKQNWGNVRLYGHKLLYLMIGMILCSILLIYISTTSSAQNLESVVQSNVEIHNSSSHNRIGSEETQMNSGAFSKTESSVEKGNLKEAETKDETKNQLDSRFFSITSRKSTTYDSGTPYFCVLARAFERTKPELIGFAHSISASGISLNKMRLFLVLTNEDEQKWDDISKDFEIFAEGMNLILGEEGFVTALPLPFLKDSDIAGFAATDRALREFFYINSTRSKTDEFSRRYSGRLHPSHCEWLVVTNGDNHYTEGWAKHINEEIKKSQLDLIYFNMIQRHKNNLLSTELKPEHIDLGAAIYRLEFLRNNSLFYYRYSGGRGYWLGSDGDFISNILPHNPRIKKMERIMLIHQ
eukprot:TRINITY_DN3889_c0_g1_i1.p1 TRINITY_DN3889_c0_g1~~TRINITY_DN3889_c0_g1_i1.p1  ORF type:complete len:356 (-),score=63.50 TRINITY_DN3889_c0_g1_i1:203-1270(-)